MSTIPDRHITHLWADLMVEELVRCGVDTFVLAPGSRSTPLVTAVTRNARARHVIHFDERGTAFFALGYGRATGRPAAWVTTSGTAVANGMPAVVEAATDGVPMLLLTADRPPELRASGANQTIDQVKLFGDYVRWFADLPAPSTDVPPEVVLTTIDQAVHRARRGPQGPVHLNAMFRKPLEPVASAPDAVHLASLTDWRAGTAPYTTYPPLTSTPDPATLDALIKRMRGIERGVVVAGRLRPDIDGAAMAAAARALGWPLIAEVTSQMRLGPTDAIGTFDTLLADAAFRQDHAVEAVLHLGALGPSKRLAHHLRDSRPALHVVVHDLPDRIDEHHRVTHRIEARPDSFCRLLAERLAPSDEPDSRWVRSWRQADADATAQLAERLATPEHVTEPFVAHAVTRHLPADHALVVASSMPVRDVNRFAAREGAPAPVAANRGASGIDGTVATAAGFAYGLDRPATLLIGDLALLHDLNSLRLLDQIDPPVTVVAINNDGGGIFHFLPIAEHDDVFEPLFGTPHGLTFEHAATMFGLRYVRAETPDAVTDAYQDAVHRDTPTLIEVPTDRRTNRAEHAELEAAVAEALHNT